MSAEEIEKMLEEILNVLDEALEVADDSIKNIEKELNRMHGVMIAMTAALVALSFGPSAKEVVDDLIDAAGRAFEGELSRREARKVMAKVAAGLDKLKEIAEGGG